MKRFLQWLRAMPCRRSGHHSYFHVREYSATGVGYWDDRKCCLCGHRVFGQYDERIAEGDYVPPPKELE